MIGKKCSKDFTSVTDELQTMTTVVLTTCLCSNKRNIEYKRLQIKYPIESILICNMKMILILLILAAARMEQCGHPGLVHMTAEAAAQLYKEGVQGAVPPPLHLTSVKSKGTMLTAW